MSKLQGLAKATAEDEAWTAKTGQRASPPRNYILQSTLDSIAYMDIYIYNYIYNTYTVHVCNSLHECIHILLRATIVICNII